mmetsp:Transcript_12677/g.25854  ORF Transcript_12677/g.25854 Transcript_12677/m.25854 type:complete len:169 (-) Transcript_12677:191-697(-)|eukprot:CAMPEP_0118650432 /NCGR_PEP_ID=MMETSP0785-20121206/10247_1 /TAXON_ID=91992 /ORGANISM="Bolidomonas pacifica, Strain CCMP 1866" /LENGTH=168 /DNA_ID=CAMNT_0006542813 /DNA_START=149 /DNA_END=655 /DNA_ORIENTATION=+
MSLLTRTLFRQSLPRSIKSAPSSSSLRLSPIVSPIVRRTLATDDTGSHSDFGAQKKSVPTGNKALELIDSHVKSNPVMLYMKGSPNSPQCGFSARVVGILQSNGASFSSVNVLEYPEIREGIKEYSDWPTIPQLYVNGEFVGGCDIVQQMEEDGELEDVLKSANAISE